jgi:CheY-like chemotaxis protein
MQIGRDLGSPWFQFEGRIPMAVILVVDDESFVRGLVEETLTSEGHTVLQAKSGTEAIKLCEERAFDLVITDLSMPLMDGFDLISTLRRLQNDLAILAISGVYTGDLLKAVKVLGAKAILEKPFELAELVAVVDKILGKNGK